jgi:hypothetical protein
VKPKARSGQSGSGLKSGLYALVPPNKEANTETSLYVIFWPEEATWDDDDAPSSVVKIRITLMRLVLDRAHHFCAAKGFPSYLTKLCDQVLCLISPEHADKLVWQTSSDQDASEDDEDSDRLFSFEVSKTNEQEESVTWRVGFEVSTAFPVQRLTGLNFRTPARPFGYARH